ncbi:MAG: OB-fold domain-containing protein [Polyangiales bacterium]
MSEEREANAPLPVVPFLKIPDGESPYLVGCVCRRCDTTFLGQRSVCSKCGARDVLDAKRLSNEGTLYAYSIVHRSLPGVAVPYISAIVDLAGGGHIKGNLINVEPNPKHIAFGMPVEVVYGDALGRKDSEGKSYLSYFFQPRRDAGAAERSAR